MNDYLLVDLNLLFEVMFTIHLFLTFDVIFRSVMYEYYNNFVSFTQIYNPHLNLNWNLTLIATSNDYSGRKQMICVGKFQNEFLSWISVVFSLFNLIDIRPIHGFLSTRVSSVYSIFRGEFRERSLEPRSISP